MTFKPTKWAGYEFSPEQEKARKKWQRAQRLRIKLAEGIRCPPDSFPMRTREGVIERARKPFAAIAPIRAEKLWDEKEKLEREAEALFPEVGDSFALASMTVRL